MVKEAIEEFQKLGFNNYEAKIYLALLERDTLSVSEISKLSRVPRVRTYDILEKLVTGGLASLIPGKYMRYRAVDFDTLENKFIDKIDKKSLEEKGNIEKVTLTLRKHLEPTLKKRNSGENNPIDYIEIIKDPYQMHKRFMDLVVEAKYEILGFTKPPYSGPRNKLEEQNEQQIIPLRRGLISRAVYEIPKDKEEIEWRYRAIDRMVKNGEKARVIESLPMKLGIFDEKTVMLPLEDPITGKTSFTVQIVKHPALAKTLKIVFGTIWNQAEDYHVLKDLIR